MFTLYCPVCGKEMVDIVFLDNGIEYPEKQCICCKTVYQLGSTSEIGAQIPEQVILAPRTKEFLKENAKKFKGLIPD